VTDVTQSKADPDDQNELARTKRPGGRFQRPPDFIYPAGRVQRPPDFVYPAAKLALVTSTRIAKLYRRPPAHL
jgi:hypothetical protein